MTISHEDVRRLLDANDVVTELWRILNKIWIFEDDIERYFREHEQETHDFEYKMNVIFYEIYDHLYERIRKEKPHIELPAVIFDGMSIREGNLLIIDLEEQGYEIVEYTYTLSALPSTTSHFREKLGMRFREIMCHKPPSEVDFDTIIWIRCPDYILHHASEILPPPKAYEITRDFLLKLLDQADVSGVITITSDHGYIITDYVWPVPERDRQFLRGVFGSYRYAKNTAISPEKLMALKAVPKYKSYLLIDEAFSYVKGRYFWPVRGPRRAIAHGGISFMECLIPLIRVRI